ncbi:MAG: hypothetical protein ACK42E_05540, partial [Candidatus Bipolaricaulaceae bacterium]
ELLEPAEVAATEVTTEVTGGLGHLLLGTLEGVTDHVTGQHAAGGAQRRTGRRKDDVIPAGSSAPVREPAAMGRSAAASACG